MELAVAGRSSVEDIGGAYSTAASCAMGSNVCAERSITSPKAPPLYMRRTSAMRRALGAARSSANRVSEGGRGASSSLPFVAWRSTTAPAMRLRATSSLLDICSWSLS